MATNRFHDCLKFIHDLESGPGAPALNRQTEAALKAGATMLRYKNIQFPWRLLPEVMAVRQACRCNRVPFLVHDDILLAKALAADGVHLDTSTEADTAAIRDILGPTALVGLSIYQAQAIENLPPAVDYVQVAPAMPCLPDHEPLSGPGALEWFMKMARLPVVVSAGSDPISAREWLFRGAAGIAVTGSVAVLPAAQELAEACGCFTRTTLTIPWQDEFGLIRKLLQTVAPDFSRPGKVLRIPPGDDACLLTALANPVITTDSQREGVHFRFEWQSPLEIGEKAVAVTLSDLAASYADPVCLFINLTLPQHVAETTLTEIYSGINRALSRYGCALGGGNISSGDVLGLDLFAVGDGREGLFPLRSAAQPDHGLYCSGPLGLARAGLTALMKKDPDFPRLEACFKLPRARFDAARILADKGVGCVMDISDGLCGDAGHIADASRITIEWMLSEANMAPELLAFCAKHHCDPMEMVLAGGEDYELLFACPPDLFEAIQQELPGAHQVGRCRPFQGRRFLDLPQGVRSFQHGGA